LEEGSLERVVYHVPAAGVAGEAGQIKVAAKTHTSVWRASRGDVTGKGKLSKEQENSWDIMRRAKN